MAEWKYDRLDGADDSEEDDESTSSVRLSCVYLIFLFFPDNRTC